MGNTMKTVILAGGQGTRLGPLGETIPKPMVRIGAFPILAHIMQIYRSHGCELCNFTGFYGRTAIHEILIMNESIKELTSQKASSDQIKKCAVANGMRTLRQNGWLKVIDGVTTPDEIS